MTFEALDRLARLNGSHSIDATPDPDMRLVNDDRPPAPALEEDVLPAGWGAWVAAEAASRGCPRDYVAAGLITASSAWIGNARYAAANATWVEPSFLWMALIGSPSTGKTPALRPGVEASQRLEREAEPAWLEALAEHARLAEGANAAEEQWKGAVRKATKDAQQPPPRPMGADIPLAPPRPRVLAMDASTEELQRLMADQPRGLLYVRDELSGWLGNFDRYGGNGGDRAFFLEAWNGGAYVVDRVKYRDKPVRIPRVGIAILGGMQPDRLREVLAGPDDGLAARLAYIYPEPPEITPLTAEPDAAARGRRERLMTAARRLYGLAMDKDPAGDPAPRLLRLAPDALALFDELRQEAMQQARSARGLAAGWFGKTGRVLRLGLCYELLTWAATGGNEPQAIGGEAMARAAGYFDYLAAMLGRVTAGLAIGQAEADAAVIARHILTTQPTTLNERDLYQRPTWAWLRDSARRAAALRVLGDAGWIRHGVSAGAGRPRGDWQVAPRLWGAS